MNQKHLINALPPKFIRFAKSAIEREITLIKDDTTPDDVLMDIANVNDIPLLQAVVDEMNNPHQTVVGDLYVLSQTADGTETTLQRFGKPIPIGETVLLVFVAQDFDKAVAITNRFLGFDVLE